MMATRRMARSGSSNNDALLIVGLMVLCAAASTTTIAAAAAANSNSNSSTTTTQQVMWSFATRDERYDGAAAARAAGLSADFHATTCPGLDDMVRTSVSDARRGNPNVTAGLLRLLFHDCFPQGCDASVLLDRSRAGSEQAMAANGGLQDAALQLVEAIRGKVHAACGATVSCADILALATSYAVSQAGGPWIAVELGRKDSRGPASEGAVGLLPRPTFSAEQLLSTFTSRGGGFDGPDVVALSGAHTVGSASCSSFSERLNKNDGDSFERELTGYCRAANGNTDLNKRRDLDATPVSFDNSYFQELQKGRGVLTSDKAIATNTDARGVVDGYAAKPGDFSAAFVRAMQKLSRLPGSTTDPGPINGSVRNHCLRPTNTNNLLLDTTTDDAQLAAAA